MHCHGDDFFESFAHVYGLEDTLRVVSCARNKFQKRTECTEIGGYDFVIEAWTFSQGSADAKNVDKSRLTLVQPSIDGMDNGLENACCMCILQFLGL